MQEDYSFFDKNVIEFVRVSAEYCNTIDNLLSEENQFLPEFKDISISNVFCRGGRKGIYINGLPEKPIHHISLKNIKKFFFEKMVCFFICFFYTCN